LSVEVSLLSAAERLSVADEAELRGRLEPGVDGVILEYAGRRATFLPQVWGTLPQPRDFLTELKLKAGVPADFWSAAVNVHRYRVTKWKESELLPARREHERLSGSLLAPVDDVIQCDFCPRITACTKAARRVLVRQRVWRRHGADDLRPLVGFLHRPDRKSRSTSFSLVRACCRSAPPAAASPQILSELGHPRRARWIR
jgi:hypothetical protein